jgi:RNA polymerase sigma factor (sigma-70 family)
VVALLFQGPVEPVWEASSMPALSSNGSILVLFERYYERVYCFARRSLDQSTAEDIAQEVFVRLMNLQNLESRSINVSYLIKIADNLIKRRHRRMRRFEAIIAADTSRTDVVHSESGELGEEADHDTGASCSEVLESLTDGEQDAVRLVVCGGLSYESAARSLDVKISTLNNWKFRGIQRLKQHADNSTQRHTGTDRRPVAGRSLSRKGAL